MPAVYRRRKPLTGSARAEVEGYRSGLEEVVGAQLKAAGLPTSYEQITIRYQQPSKPRRYTPDFPLPNGVIVETKGRFVTADRQKHLHIKADHPDLDIRFVFSNPNAKIGKKSKTSYADWCDRAGFLWAARRIPEEWLKEPTNKASLDALIRASKT